MIRDMEIINIYYPLVKPTFQETINQFSGNAEEKAKALTMLILKIYDLRDRTIKGIMFGTSTSDIRESVSMLSERNSSLSYTYQLTEDPRLYSYNIHDYNDLYYLYNYSILNLICKTKVNWEKYWNIIPHEQYNMFLMDPHVSKSVKKRIMMFLIATNRISNIELWTDKTGTILHDWIIRQKYDEKERTWFGDCDLMLFSGSKRFRVRYNSTFNVYSLNKLNITDPEEIHQFLSEACEILNVPMDKFLSRVSSGNYVLSHNKIIKLVKGSFNITDYVQPIPIKQFLGEVVLDGDYIRLETRFGRVIFSNPTGLLAVSRDVEFKVEDFEINGMLFSDIISIGAMSANFDINYKFRSETIKFIKDLKVDKPSVTEVTKKRLGLHGQWDIIEEKVIEELETEVTVLGGAVYPEEALMVDVSFIDDFNWGRTILDDYIGHFTPEYFQTMETVSQMIPTKKILYNVLHLKYFLICHQVLNDMRVNKKTISTISKLNVKEITWSLIFYYNTLNVYEHSISPEGIFVSIFEDFSNTFIDSQEINL
jgi:hypothetical protein